MIVLLLFFCSGATALVYEVIWSKYLALLFGSTIQAQTVVLAIFMGGLALGNRLFGGRADRARQPLAVYGCLEVAIGLYACFFSFLYKVSDGIFVRVGSRLLEHTAGLLLFKGILSAALLLGPTILMGGTLPLVAAWLQRSTTDAGRRSARFYSTNSLGAVCGAGLAGFVLVQWIGMPITLQLTAFVNALIGFTAIGIARAQTAQLSTPGQNTEDPKPVPVQPQVSSAVFRWGCTLVTLTGAVSMGLEVLASRCLCLIFGASLQAFAIVLMAFILGIGAGSAVIASPRRKHWPKEITTITLLLGAAAWIGLLVFNIENLVDLYRYARSGLSRTDMGYCYHQLLAGVISIFVLGLPAAALGSVLPLWIRVASETSDQLGDRVGRLLTWNTLGAVGGVLLTGFVLMPGIGLRGSFAALAMVLAVAAVAAAWATRQRTLAVTGVVIGGLLAWVSMTGGQGWQQVLSSGVFREHDAELARIPMRVQRQFMRLLFYEDAADATVSVERNERPGSIGQLVLRVNGKADATSHGDLSTQFLLAHLPLMAKPESKDVFCFGMGSGITAGAVLGYPIERLTVAENCEPVLRAAKQFEPWNRGVLTNGRVHINREDARTVLKLSPHQYDVIIAEPSNPWAVGVGSVFSREFYQLAANRLKPGGIMAQWFHLYEMHDGIVDLVVRTFGTVFPVMEIWDASDGDIILLGSDRPWKSGVEAYRRAFDLRDPRRDLTLIGVASPEAVLARQFASQRTAFAVTGSGLIQLDEFPVLEYEAPRAFYLGVRAQGLQRFDERTWQMDLAPAEKRHVLAALDDESLKEVFGGVFRSVNMDLQSYLHSRFTGRLGENFNLVLRGRPMPCIFRGTNNTVSEAQPIVVTNDVTRAMFDAEVALRRGVQDPLPAIEYIKDVLDRTERYERHSAGWSAAYYADLAVRASLRLDHVAQAKAILLRGLQLEPDSAELGYLSRILVREGSLQPAELPPAITR